MFDSRRLSTTKGGGTPVPQPAPLLALQGISILLFSLATLPLHADTHKLSQDQERELVRGLTAEWAVAKISLPMSKKPLPVDSLGERDHDVWNAVLYKEGPAARAGDMVQITKIKVGDDKIVVEINDGSKKGSFWDHVVIGGSAGQVPVQRPKTNAMMGTSIEVKFPDTIGNIDSVGLKKILSSVLNFDLHTAVATFVETLPQPVQEAIRAKKAIVGMDREQVVLAMGVPRTKSRETKDDVDYEDYVYGLPPGVITFVRFAGSKVDQVKEMYANMGTGVAVTVDPGK
ncbi:MAG: hypothetical protein ABI824_08870 [Acidobacteriota bacterium]